MSRSVPHSTARSWVFVKPLRNPLFFSAMTAAISVMIASQWLPRVYEAQVRFERKGRPPDFQGGSHPTAPPALNGDPEAMVRAIKGPDAIAAILGDKDLGLTGHFPVSPDGQLTESGRAGRSELIRQTQDRIRVDHERVSDDLSVIKVTYSDQDRTRAPLIANRLVEHYITRTHKDLKESLLSIRQRCENQIKRLRPQVDDLSRTKRRFEQDHPELVEGGPETVAIKLATVRTSLDAIKSQIHQLKEQDAVLTRWLKAQHTHIKNRTRGPNPAQAELKQQRSTLSGELDEHRRRWNRTDEHPLVSTTLERLTQIDQAIDQTPAQADVAVKIELNRAALQTRGQIEGIRARLAALKARRIAMQNQLRRLEGLSRQLADPRGGYTQTLRKLKAAKAALQVWETQLRHTARALDDHVRRCGLRLSFIERAPEDLAPRSPTPEGVFTATLGIGLGTGLLVVLLTGLPQRTISSPHHAEAILDLPVLGATGEIVRPATARRRRLVHSLVLPLLAGAMALILLAVAYLTYLSLESPQPPDLLIRRWIGL